MRWVGGAPGRAGRRERRSAAREHAWPRRLAAPRSLPTPSPRALPLLPCMWRSELRSIHLRTLNKERAEIIAQHWLQEGRVPSPRQARRPLAAPPGRRAGLGTAAFRQLLACLPPTCPRWLNPVPPCSPHPAVPAVQVSEEERFVLPPHIEGEMRPGLLVSGTVGSRAAAALAPSFRRACVPTPPFQALGHPGSAARLLPPTQPNPHAVGHMPLVIGSLDRCVRGATDLALLEQQGRCAGTSVRAAWLGTGASKQLAACCRQWCAGARGRWLHVTQSRCFPTSALAGTSDTS